MCNTMLKSLLRKRRMSMGLDEDKRDERIVHAWRRKGLELSAFERVQMCTIQIRKQR